MYNTVLIIVLDTCNFINIPEYNYIKYLDVYMEVDKIQEEGK